MTELKMTYGEYKNSYYDCATKKESYDHKTKMVTVLIPEHYADVTTSKAAIDKLETMAKEDPEALKAMYINMTDEELELLVCQTVSVVYQQGFTNRSQAYDHYKKATIATRDAIRGK